MLKENSLAQDFTLLDETGVARSLTDYRGKDVVLYFYPKDDTPGCTAEACSFRDDYSAFEKTNVVILGVSADNPKSHKKFKEKYQLPFTLLSDETHEVCEKYGTWALKKMMGREYMGILRTTYLISKEGLIKKVFENVKPAGHSQEILSLI
jgi:thioredoxin-dependent peroxiredoxin